MSEIQDGVMCLRGIDVFFGIAGVYIYRQMDGWIYKLYVCMYVYIYMYVCMYGKYGRMYG